MQKIWTNRKNRSDLKNRKLDNFWSKFRNFFKSSTTFLQKVGNWKSLRKTCEQTSEYISEVFLKW